MTAPDWSKPRLVAAAAAYTPTAHYRRSDGAECCVHAVPVAPASCPDCWDIAKWDAADAMGDAPICAHCGEPFGGAAVLATPGWASRDDYVWHAGRPLCAAAAQSHRALINELGYVVPPMPVLDPNRPDGCSEPPCRDTEICAKHELAADHAEGDHRFCGPECGDRVTP